MPQTDGLADLEAAIRQTIFRYCRAVDRCDRDMIISCFITGARVTYPGIVDGTVGDFADYVLQAHAKLKAHSHMIGNILIEKVGQGVRSEAYGSIRLWRETYCGISEISVRNRYLDTWAQAGGQWLISERLHIIDLRAVDGRPDPEAFSGRIGRQDRADISYDFFSGRNISEALSSRGENANR